MKEQGIDIRMPFWESIVVPVNTPTGVIAALDAAIRKAFENAGVQKKSRIPVWTFLI